MATLQRECAADSDGQKAEGQGKRRAGNPPFPQVESFDLPKGSLSIRNRAAGPCCDGLGVQGEREAALRTNAASRRRHWLGMCAPQPQIPPGGRDLLFVEGTLLDQFFARADQGPQTLSKQLRIKRLLERLVDGRAIEAHRAAVIGQQRDQNRFAEVGILAQVLADL
jgi:hypothetical protein